MFINRQLYIYQPFFNQSILIPDMRAVGESIWDLQHSLHSDAGRQWRCLPVLCSTKTSLSRPLGSLRSRQWRVGVVMGRWRSGRRLSPPVAAGPHVSGSVAPSSWSFTPCRRVRVVRRRSTAPSSAPLTAPSPACWRSPSSLSASGPSCGPSPATPRCPAVTTSLSSSCWPPASSAERLSSDSDCQRSSVMSAATYI